MDLIEPTADEAKNGWDAKSLTAHVEQSRAETDRAYEAHLSARQRPTTAVNAYDPLRWRP